MKPKSELILYQTEDNRTRIEVRLENETVWLTLNQLVELFQRDKSVISKHIKNIFEEGELRSEATVAKYATVQTEGARTVSRDLEFYNLDVIIAVGYRVKSHRGTQFRQWANYPEIPDNCRRRHNLRFSYQGSLDNCRQTNRIGETEKMSVSAGKAKG